MELQISKKWGKRRWGNPSGTQEGLDTYEIRQKEDGILVATTKWANASAGEINRSAILTTVFPGKNYNSLGPGFRMVELHRIIFPKDLAQKGISRDDSLIEIRHYGNFTIGRKEV